jgi:hypothetical protein
MIRKSEQLCPGTRLAFRFVGDVFGKGIVLHPSDAKSHSLAQDKYLVVENIDEKKRGLQAILSLDNSMACGVKAFDCSRHARSPGPSIPR